MRVSISGTVVFRTGGVPVGYIPKLVVGGFLGDAFGQEFPGVLGQRYHAAQSF